MPVCQFFLKGTCKFGDQCFNEHRRPDNRGSYNQGRGSHHNQGHGNQRNYQQGRQDFGGGGGGGGGGGRNSTRGNYGGNNDHYNQGYRDQKNQYQDRQDFGGGRNSTHGNYGGNNDHYNQGYRDQKSHYQDRQDFGGGGGGGRGSYGGNHHGGNQRSGNYGRDQYHYVRNPQSHGNTNRYAALSHQPDPEFSNFDQRSQPKPRSNSTSHHSVTLDQRLDRVKKDIKEWEESGQWPWSCYATFANDSCYEGLVDISPEEVRVEAYEAIASGNAGSYTQSIQQTTQKYMHRKRELSNMSLASLQQEMSRSSQPSGGTTGGLFGNLTSSGSPFGSNQTSLFGNSTPPATTTTSNGLFGSSLQSMSTSGPSSFSSSMFPATTSSGPFGSSSGSTMSFVEPSMSLSGSAQGNPTITADSSEPQSSTSATNSRHTGAPALRCSEQDLKAFKDEYFVLGSIPECPPPPELC